MELQADAEGLAMQLMVTTMEAVVSQDLMSIRKFKSTIEGMPVRGRQIYLVNLKKMMAQRAYYRTRINAKQYDKFIKLIDGLLQESYKAIKNEHSS